jgi:hypothetical protein
MSRNAMAVSSTSCTSEFLAQQIPFSVQCLQIEQEEIDIWWFLSGKIKQSHGGGKN